MPQDARNGDGIVSLIIADDHKVVRTGLRLLLEAEPDFRVLAEADDVPSTRRILALHRPDVLVLDLNMPGESSLSALPGLLELSPGTATVILTMQDDPAFARESLKRGALAYVLKGSAENELVEAVRRVAAGDLYLNPRLGAVLALDREPGLPDELDEDEVELLRLVALGYTNADIGRRLYMSGRTVEAHRSRLQRRLGLDSRAELVRYVLDRGLLEL